MRIDKYLKVSRLIKRRETAKELCQDDDILINGKPAKPSYEVSIGDRITLMLGRRKLIIEVYAIREFANKEQAETMYQLLSDELLERSIDA